MGSDVLPGLGDDRPSAGLGGLDDELVSVLAQVLAEEIETIIYPRDARFLPGQGQTTLLKKRFEYGYDNIPKQLIREARDDELAAKNEQRQGEITKISSAIILTLDKRRSYKDWLLLLPSREAMQTNVP